MVPKQSEVPIGQHPPLPPVACALAHKRAAVWQFPAFLREIRRVKILAVLHSLRRAQPRQEALLKDFLEEVCMVEDRALSPM